MHPVLKLIEDFWSDFGKQRVPGGMMTESEPTINSSKLLRRFASDGSEESFARLMREHLDHVYSVAVRRVGGDSHLARDVTQTVFADLVRKLRNRGSDPFGSTPLSGWLHQHTCFVSSKLIRTEQRRRNREEIAAMNRMNEDRTDWSQLAPVIDEAVVQLPESDRIAVLLRFYERRDLRALGQRLGISEDAAQKRVSRALDRLRDILSNRGITSTAAALSAVLGHQAVAAAPGGLLASVCSAALAEAALPAVATSASTWMGFGKFQAVGTGLAAVGLVSLLVVQKRETSELKEANRVLERRIAAMTQAPPNPAGANLAEMEHLRSEHAELLRLRGQVAAQRRAGQSALTGSNPGTNVGAPARTNQLLAPDEFILTSTPGIDPGEPPPPASKTIRRVAKSIYLPLKLEELANQGTSSPSDAAQSVLWAALNDPQSFCQIVADDSSMLAPGDKFGGSEKVRSRLVKALQRGSGVVLHYLTDSTWGAFAKDVCVDITIPDPSVHLATFISIKPVADRWVLEQVGISESHIAPESDSSTQLLLNRTITKAK